MITKYNWSKVPSHVQWIATDSDDFELWFTSKPKIFMNVTWADTDSDSCFAMHSPSSFKGAWKESLEQRPPSCHGSTDRRVATVFDTLFNIIVLAHKPVSTATIQKRLNISVRQAQRYVQDLVKLNYLERTNNYCHPPEYILTFRAKRILGGSHVE